MKYINPFNIPEGIVDVIEKDTYSSGGADYTFSSLNVPPQIRRLMQLYNDKIVIDVADEIYKILGSSVHYILAEEAQKQYLNKLEASINEIQLEINSNENLNNAELGERIRRTLSNLDKVNVKAEKRYFLRLGKYLLSGQPDRWKYTASTRKIEDYNDINMQKIFFIIISTLQVSWKMN